MEFLPNNGTNRFLSTKSFTGFPCSHRQWSHDGHCKFIHGYSREFHFTFSAYALELPTNFVVEFGALKEIKKWLDSKFDHTCLINEDDPEMELLNLMHEKGIINMVVLPNVSMEATAKYVTDYLNEWLYNATKGRAWVCKAEVRENEKNSGIYCTPQHFSSYIPPIVDISPLGSVVFEQVAERCKKSFVTGVLIDSEAVVKVQYYDSEAQAREEGDYRYRLSVEDGKIIPSILNPI